MERDTETTLDNEDEMQSSPGSSINLALISQKNPKEDELSEHTYYFDKALGENQYIYVLDTGIDVEHKGFENVSYTSYPCRFFL